MNERELIESWEKPITECWAEYHKQTDTQFYQLYTNGFIGVGKLKKPEEHEKKEVNTVLIMLYLTFDNVPDSYNRIAITKEEAISLYENLGNILKN